MLLILVDHTYPSEHAFLEEVYAKRFASRGCRVAWVFRRGEKSLRWGLTSWHGTTVYLAPNEELYSVFLRPLLNVLFLFRASRIATREGADILQVRNWIWAGYCVLFICRSRGLPFAFQWSFPMQDAVAQQMRLERRSLLLVYRQAKNAWRRRANEFLMRRADRVFPVSDEMRRRLLARGFAGEKIVTVPLGCVPEHTSVDADSLAAVRASLGLENRPVVGYIGSLHWSRDPAFMIRMFGLVRRDAPDAVLLLVGGSASEVRDLRNSIEPPDRPHVVFTGKVPRAAVPQYLALCDVCVSPIPEQPEFEASAPTKLVEYMCAGKAVVGTRIVEQARVLEESGGGITASFDERAFAAAVVALLTDAPLRERMGQRGRAYATGTLSYDLLADRLQGTYLTLTRRGQRDR